MSKGPHALRILELARIGREHSPAPARPKPPQRAPQPAPAAEPPPDMPKTEYCCVDLGEFVAPNGWKVRAHAIAPVEVPC